MRGKTIGFIGCGNMGGAVAKAVCKAVDPESVLLANKTPEKAESLSAELYCRTGDNHDAAACKYVFLAVKPHMMADMLLKVQSDLAEGEVPVLISMAAGLPMQRIREMAGGDYPVIRMMPNTPTSIGEGMIQFCTLGVDREDVEYFVEMMKYAGRVDAIDESLIDAASCVSGCGPAWAYMFIEALADGGVACGLPRAKAMEYAAQMLKGSAELVIESGNHPGALKDAVCSPGGSTIQGVRSLEENGFRGAVIDAVISAFDKTKEMAKK